VLQWLCHDGLGLTKLTFRVRKEKNVGIIVSRMEYKQDKLPDNTKFIKINI